MKIPKRGWTVDPEEGPVWNSGDGDGLALEEVGHPSAPLILRQRATLDLRKLIVAGDAS